MDNSPQTTAWSVDERQLDPNADINEKLRFALRYAVLAPSNHNTQPWHFIVGGDSVTLCADRTRALPVVDPFDRELLISCGAALFNLRVALSRFGLGYAITLLPSAVGVDVLARGCMTSPARSANRLRRRVPERPCRTSISSVRPPASRSRRAAGSIAARWASRCACHAIASRCSRKPRAISICRATPTTIRDHAFKQSIPWKNISLT